jgi:CheY-like chemotaxis protein
MIVTDNQINVLIVDDEECIRESMSYILGELGFAPEEANNGKEALDKVSQKRPDVIILDVAMPVMDGIETCKRLRENPDTRDIPVVFLSGQAHIDQMISNIPGPKIKCMEKPCDIKYLAEQICLLA